MTEPETLVGGSRIVVVGILGVIVGSLALKDAPGVAVGDSSSASVGTGTGNWATDGCTRLLGIPAGGNNVVEVASERGRSDGAEGR